MIKINKKKIYFLTFHNLIKIRKVIYQIKINFKQVQKYHPKINY